MSQLDTNLSVSRSTLFSILILSCCLKLTGQTETKAFKFDFEGRQYSGAIDIPAKAPKSLVILVPGSGPTNMVAGDEIYDNICSAFVQFGLAVMVYDKAGCGESQGTFDYNQSVQNSSEELLSAIGELRRLKIPGSKNIGLWSLSRGGWISPLAISQDPQIAYWISASGPDHLETIGYFFEANWRVNGRSESEIDLLYSEWLEGYTIQRKGGSYEEYLAASPNLSKDPMILSLRGGKFNTEENYYSFQKVQQNKEFDEETGLEIVVPDFSSILKKTSCPVLAIFGESDSQVDWQRSKVLYKRTIGLNGKLTSISLPNCNHLLLSCETGGYQENLEELKSKGLGRPCEGYFNAIQSWLIDLGYISH